MNKRIGGLALALALSGWACKGSEKNGDEKPPAPSASDKSAEVAKDSPPPKMAKAAEAKVEAPKTELPKDSGKHKGTHMWSTPIGGINQDVGRSVAVSPKGGVAIAGYFSIETTIGEQTFKVAELSDPKKIDENDGFIAAYDDKGAPTWSRQLGGKGDQLAKTVTFDPQGNAIVAGWFGIELNLGDGTMTTEGADDIFIIKLDPTGRRLWAKRFGGDHTDAADDVAVDAAGNIYVTGVYRNEVDFEGTKLKSAGMADIYLLKMNPDGEVVFAKSFGERYDDFGRALTIDTQGNIVLFGEFSNKVSFGGEALQSVANRDIFLAKFTSTGEHIWSKGMGTDLDEVGLSVATDPTDSIIITGVFEEKMSFGGEPFQARGKGDVFLAKYDKNGAHLWSKQFGNKEEDIGSDVGTDSFGNIIVTGWFRVAIDFGGGPLKSVGKRDTFIAKLSPSGEHLWSKSFGGKESDAGRSLAVASDNSVVASGSFLYKVSVGGPPLEYAQKDGGLIPYGDIYLARFGP